MTKPKLRKQSKNSLPITITIPNYKCPSRNKTATAHWRTYMQYRDELADFIAAYTYGKWLIKPATVTITAYYKGKRRHDVSNIDDKMVLDALMKVGILEDDDITCNPCVIKKGFVDCKTDSLEVEVKGGR